MTKTKFTFETAMARLNEISELMNGDELPLEDALKLYSEAGNLVAVCKKEIDGARLTLREIFDENGES